MATVAHARDIARTWVREHAGAWPGFAGAFLAGSTCWRNADDVVPATSDVDVVVVLDTTEAPPKVGKFVAGGVVLDVSFALRDELRSPAAVLSDYHRAGSFRTPAGILADPTGALGALQAAVADAYPQRRWVLRRCAHVRSKLLDRFDALSPAQPVPERIISWVFPTGLVTHILLVADLRNGTVRRRYADVRDLLTAHGRPEVHERLLAQLGCADMSCATAERHLAALTAVFDVAAGVARSTHVPFASDLAAAARPATIEGTRELVTAGLHREAVFWMVVTWAKCRVALRHGPPEVRDHGAVGFRRLLSDLGVASWEALHRRRAQVERSLPAMWELAEQLTSANPQVRL